MSRRRAGRGTPGQGTQFGGRLVRPDGHPKVLEESGGHRKPRAVDKASDVPLELNVIKAKLAGFDFKGVFLI